MAKKRVVAYIRVSHDEQRLHGFSIQAQKEALEKYAKENNMLIVEWYFDEGISARHKMTQRKALQKLLKDVPLGHFEMIIFIKIDRWFRSVSDYYKVQDVLDEHGIVWKATQEDYNTETRDGRLKINLMLSIAQDESDRTSERIKFVNESKLLNKGVLSGSQTIGYCIGEIDGVKRVVKNLKYERMVHDIFDHFELHKSKRATMEFINDKYNMSLSYRSYTRYLTDRRYTGWYKGVEDYCEPYISVERFDRIQEILKNNGNVKRTKHTYLFTGKVVCPDCENIMVGQTIERKTKTFVYLRCNKAHQDKQCWNKHRINEKYIEKFLLENIEKQLEEFLIQAQIEEDTNPEPIINVKDLEEEMERLNYMFQKKRIKLDFYESEIDRIESRLAEIGTPKPKKDFEKLRAFLESDFKTIYDTLDRNEKRSLWLSIIERIIPDGKGGYKVTFL